MLPAALVAPLLFAASAVAQAVPEGIAPSSPAPSGCVTTSSQNFTIGTLDHFQASKHRRETAQQAADGALFCNLKNGILRDQYGRTGSVVANRQFQFDGPPQAGAIYTGGFSVCKNNSLAIGGSTRWWRCMSGSFGNLYDEWIGNQCTEIRIQVGLPEQASSSAAPTSSASPSLVSRAQSSTVTDATSLLSATALGPTASSLAQSGNATTSSARSSATAASVSVSSRTGSAGVSAASATSTGAGSAPPASGAAAMLSATAAGSVLALCISLFGTFIVL